MADSRFEWGIVYRSPNQTDCREHALVLGAAGIAHEVRPEAGELIILVAASDADRSRAELDAYASENRDWPTARFTVPRPANGWAGVLCYATVLSIVAVWQQQHSFGVDWLEAGTAQAGLIRQGQWWLTVTALTLHADLVHLIGNVIIGGLVGLFAGRSFGSGRAWFGILIGGALGNLLNAWLHPAGHASIGASTAVFAALGLLAGHAWRQNRWLRTSRMEKWAPIVGGALLLSLLGTGGGRTDVGAHVFGFLCGALVGALGERADRAWSQLRAQLIFGGAALTILAVAWAFALTPN
jgi:membrane associated rhomboid family serine protease